MISREKLLFTVIKQRSEFHLAFVMYKNRPKACFDTLVFYAAICIACIPIGRFILRHLTVLFNRFCGVIHHKQSKQLS